MVVHIRLTFTALFNTKQKKQPVNKGTVNVSTVWKCVNRLLETARNWCLKSWQYSMYVFIYLHIYFLFYVSLYVAVCRSCLSVVIGTQLIVNSIFCSCFRGFCFVFFWRGKWLIDKITLCICNVVLGASERAGKCKIHIFGLLCPDQTLCGSMHI